MSSKTKYAALAVFLVVVIAFAAFAYRSLGTDEPETAADTIGISGTDSAVNAAKGSEPAADFTVYDGNMKEVRLSDFKGKPVVVNFWATWCIYCVREFPQFEDAYRRYGDRVNFVMVDLTDNYRETMDSAKDFIRKNDYTFPVYYDMKNSADNAYNISSIPVSLFIDAGGNIVDTHVGAMSETMLDSYLVKLTGG
jgi:thiol-disulfide isomerase/thioredoxin